MARRAPENTNTPLRVLLVEDSEADAQLLLRELRSGGYSPAYRRVASAQAMASALEDERWDLVVCDYSMPQFSAPAALGILKNTGIDLPFIIVSGAISEELAVEAMKAGAHDFLIKDKLARLVPAVERELGEAEVRRGKRTAEEEFRRLNAELEQRVADRTAELERANERLGAIQQVTDVSLAQLSLDEMLRELLIRVRKVLGTDTATILLLSEDEQQLVVRASSGLETGASETIVPVGKGIAGRIAAIGEPLIVEDVSREEVVRPVLKEKVRSLIGAPLCIGDRVTGVLHAGTTQTRHFTEEDLRLIQVVADRAASTIERARAEDERDRLLAEVSAIFTSLADPVLVFDETGRPMRANPAAAAIYDADPVLHGLAEFIHRANIRHPDGSPFSEEEMPGLRALREKKVVGDRFITTNTRGEDVVVQVAASPLVVNGELKGAVGLWHDISERERLLAEVDDARSRFEAVLASAAHGILIHTQSGNLSYMNAEAESILGYSKEIWNSSPEDRVKLMRAETMDGEPLPEEQAPTRRALQGETVHNMPAVIVRGDGNRIWLSISTAPIRTEAGEVLGAVTTFADVTAQHRLEEDRERLLARVQESEGLYRSLFDSISQAFSLLRVLRNEEGVASNLLYVEANPAVERNMGKSRDELVGKTFDEVWPGHLQPWLEMSNQVLATGEPARIERYSEPARRWVDVYVFSPARDLIAMLTTDITERKLAEAERESLLEEVQRRAAELEATVAAVPDGLVINGPSEEVLLMNEAAVRLLGYAPEQRSLSMAERVAVGRFETASGEPMPLGRFPAYRALRGETVLEEVFVFRLPVSGTPRWLSISSAPVRREDGTLLGAVTILRDITEQHDFQGERDRLLEEVQSRAAELNAIISSIPDGVVIYDASGQIVSMNYAAEQMYGYSPAEWRLPLAERLRALKVENVEGQPYSPEEAPLLRALKGETVKGVVAKINRPGGKPIWTSNSAAPIFSADGSIVGIVGTMADITALHELQERQRDLTRMISHDLRNPLTAVQGQAQYLARVLARAGGQERLQRSAEAIYTGARRMDAMIQDLVDMARSESGQLQTNPTRLDLGPYVEELKQRFAGVLDARRIHMEFPSELSPVWTDPNRLERIFVNLLSNALKYSDPGSEVLVSANNTGGEVAVSVSDRGVGISPEDMDHIFERFYRSRGARKTEGLGLGLYITRMMVEAMGGRIWVESDAGQGSTFSFTLPTAPDSSQAS